MKKLMLDLIRLIQLVFATIIEACGVKPDDAHAIAEALTFTLIVTSCHFIFWILFA